MYKLTITMITDIDIYNKFVNGDNKMDVFIGLYKRKKNLSVETLFGTLTSYILGEYNEIDTQHFIFEYSSLIIQKCVYTDLLMNDLMDYIENTYSYNEIFNILHKLLKEINYIYICSDDNNRSFEVSLVVSKKIWSFEIFKNCISMFPVYVNGIDYVSRISLFSSFVRSRKINFEVIDKIFDTYQPLIEDENAVSHVLNHIFEILLSNVQYTYDNAVITRCSSLCFTNMVMLFLIKIYKHYFNDDYSNITNVQYTVIINNYNIEIFKELSLHHKIYFAFVYSISTCFLYLIKNYIIISLTPKEEIRPNLQIQLIEIKQILAYNIKNKTHDFIMMTFMKYYEVFEKFYIIDMFNLITKYIELYCKFEKITNYYIPNKCEYCKLLLNIMTNEHINNHYKFESCKVLLDIFDKSLYLSIDSMYEKLIKYLSSVSTYYDWTDFLISQKHFEKTIDMIIDLDALYSIGKIELDIESVNDYIEGFLYNICNISLNNYDNFVKFCNKHASSLNTFDLKSDVSMIKYLIKTINIYDKFYIKGITKTYSELDIKYTTMIIYILNTTLNAEHNIYNFFKTPHICCELIDCIFESMYMHIDRHKTEFSEFKETIINKIDNYSSISNYKKNKIINSLNQKTIKYDLSSEFLDPLLSIPIEHPMKIPNVNEIFDQSSIVTYVKNNNKNPYTRELFSYNELIEYNNRPEIVDELKQFSERKKNYDSMQSS